MSFNIVNVMVSKPGERPQTVSMPTGSTVGDLRETLGVSDKASVQLQGYGPIGNEFQLTESDVYLISTKNKNA